MEKLKVIKVNSESIEFEGGVLLESYHSQDCCENHYLSMNDLTIDDFKGLEFDLTNDKFFKRIEGYGIELIPLRGHSVRIPGYGENNGYYSDQLELMVYQGQKTIHQFDITECQEDVF